MYGHRCRTSHLIIVFVGSAHCLCQELDAHFRIPVRPCGPCKKPFCRRCKSGLHEKASRDHPCGHGVNLSTINDECHQDMLIRRPHPRPRDPLLPFTPHAAAPRPLSYHTKNTVLNHTLYAIVRRYSYPHSSLSTQVLLEEKYKLIVVHN